MVSRVVMVVLLLGACTQQRDEQVVLSEYAQKHDGFWVNEVGGLKVGLSGKDIDLNSLLELPERALAKIESLEIQGRLVRLPNLKSLRNLREFFLSSNSVENIAALWECEKLEMVNLSDDSITSIEGIKNLKKLKIFRANDTPISDITELNSLPQLHTVDLWNSKLKRLPDLSGTEIRFLAISRTPIESLDNIETLKNPFELWIDGCYNLKDIDALAQSNVSVLVYDEELYHMFQSWFDEHLPKLREKNPEFKALFESQYDRDL